MADNNIDDDAVRLAILFASLFYIVALMLVAFASFWLIPIIRWQMNT